MYPLCDMPRIWQSLSALGPGLGGLPRSQLHKRTVPLQILASVKQFRKKSRPARQPEFHRHECARAYSPPAGGTAPGAAIRPDLRLHQ